MPAATGRPRGAPVLEGGAPAGRWPAVMRRLRAIAFALTLSLPLVSTADAEVGACPNPVVSANDRGVSDWTWGAVVYGVVPPLFGGEPLDAVTARLDELAALGVDALWLSPILATDDPSAISYSVTDYFRVRPDFGTEASLRALVDAAHARGMKVLMDFVPNHSSIHHPWFEARPDFYDRDAAGEATHYFHWRTLKNLNYDSPALRAEMIRALTYWVVEYDVDGFRVDASWGIQQRAPDFWPEAVKALERIKPDVFLLAEASARDPYWVRQGFDAAYDWTEAPGQWAWDGIFEDPETIGPGLREALSQEATPPHRVARFLNNNDTGARFITRHGVAITRVATVLLHALPGIPIVYTGDEVGAEFDPYADPPPLDWSRDPHGLRPLYRKLATLREEVPALRCGGLRVLDVPGHGAAFAFLREPAVGHPALVVTHFGDQRASLTVKVPETFPALPLRDLLTGVRVPMRRVAKDTLTLEAGASTAMILVPDVSAPAP